MPYSSGDHHIICYGCGFKILKSEALRNHEGNWYCKKDWDDLHPHERETPKILDPKELPKHLVRPEGDVTEQQCLGNWEDVDLYWELIAVEWQDFCLKDTTTRKSEL